MANFLLTVVRLLEIARNCQLERPKKNFILKNAIENNISFHKNSVSLA